MGGQGMWDKQERKNAYRVLVEKLEWKKYYVGDLGLHWVDNIRMDEEQIGMGWICLVQDTDQQ